MAGTRKRRALAHKGSSKTGLELRNDINVTPLVDVCLVLLIIFMVIMPMLQRGKDVPLPETVNHLEDTDNQQPIVAITLDPKNGALRYYFDQERIEVGTGPDKFRELQRRVEQHWKALPEDSLGRSKVFVKANVEVPYGEVRPVIFALRDLGLAEIDLGTNEAKKDKGN